MKKKNTPKSNGKAKTVKTSPVKTVSKVKTESNSPSKSKVENKKKLETDQTTKSTSKPSTPDEKEEKQKINHPFFTKQHDLKLQSSEDTSNGASYDPGKSNYHPIKDCFWKHGEK